MIATHVLRGSIDEARGRHDAAAAAFGRAVAIQDNLYYGDPPDWYFPVREALGTTLLAAGRLEEAEEVFRADLRQHCADRRP